MRLSNLIALRFDEFFTVHTWAQGTAFHRLVSRTELSKLQKQFRWSLKGGGVHGRRYSRHAPGWVYVDVVCTAVSENCLPAAHTS